MSYTRTNYNYNYNYNRNKLDLDPELIGTFIGTSIVLPFAIPFIASVAWGLSKWKVGSDITQTGVIDSIGKVGFFHKTNEMSLRVSKYGNGSASNTLGMSLRKNETLVKKAQECAEHGSFVRVKYDQYCFPKWFKAGSSRIVKDIQEISPTNQTPKTPSIKR